MVEEKKEQPDSDALKYEELAMVIPERPEDEINIPDELESGKSYKSLKDQMAEAPNLSDMQTADRRLFPPMPKEHLQVLQVGRVFAERYLPLQAILVKDLLMNNNDMSMAEAITYVEVAESIADNGEGRIDELVLVGATKEQELKKEEFKMGA